MNLQKEIDFDECYRRHFFKYPDDSSNSEEDSELDQNDIDNRPLSLLSHTNDTIEYCTAEPKNKTSNGSLTVKTSQPKESSSNRLPILDIEETYFQEQYEANGNDKYWNLSNGTSSESALNSNNKSNDVYSSVIKLNPETGIQDENYVDNRLLSLFSHTNDTIKNYTAKPKSKTSKGSPKKSQPEEKGSSNRFSYLESEVRETHFREQHETNEDDNYWNNNVGSKQSNGNKVKKNDATLSKKSTKKKSPVVPELVSKKKNKPVQTGALKKTLPSPLNKKSRKSTNGTLPNKVATGKKVPKTSATQQIHIIPNMNPTKTLVDSIIYPNMLPVINLNPNQFPSLPPPDWYVDDINFPSLKPDTPINFSLENFPPLGQPSGLQLNKHNFPPIRPTYFNKPKFADLDEKIAEFALTADATTTIKPKKNKQVPQNFESSSQKIDYRMNYEENKTYWQELPIQENHKLKVGGIIAGKPESAIVDIVENQILEGNGELQNLLNLTDPVITKKKKKKKKSTKNKDSTLKQGQDNVERSKLNQSSTSELTGSIESGLNKSFDCELNTSFDAELDRSIIYKLNQSNDSEQNTNFNDDEDSSKLPLDENYVQLLAQKFLLGELSIEQIWYVELGHNGYLHLLDEPISKSNRRFKNQLHSGNSEISTVIEKPKAILNSLETHNETFKTNNTVVTKSDRNEILFETNGKRCETISFKELDDLNVNYFSILRNPDELSISEVYTCLNESLISFCDDHISKYHVNSILDSNTGVVTMKSPVSITKP